MVFIKGRRRKMADAHSKVSILAGIDEILDTRFGTLLQYFSQEQALAVLKHGYLERKRDEFYGIDKEYFDSVYAIRNVDTLKRSRPTALVTDLKRLITGLTEQGIITPYHDGGNMLLNLYPYHESLDKAQQEAIRLAVFHLMGRQCAVSLITLPPSSLTPSLIEQHHIAAMYMYEPHTWLESQTKAFQRVRIPEVSLLSPQLYISPVPSEAELLSLDKIVQDPFKAQERLASIFVKLSHLPVNVFSIANDIPVAIAVNT